METGVLGLLLELAAAHVEVEHNPALVFATILHRPMVEPPALDQDQSHKPATRKSAPIQQVGPINCCFLQGNVKN
jgi:hypothetical protein